VPLRRRTERRTPTEASTHGNRNRKYSQRLDDAPPPSRERASGVAGAAVCSVKIVLAPCRILGRPSPCSSPRTVATTTRAD